MKHNFKSIWSTFEESWVCGNLEKILCKIVTN